MSLNDKDEPIPPEVRLTLAAHFGNALILERSTYSSDDEALVERAFSLADKFLAKARP